MFHYCIVQVGIIDIIVRPEQAHGVKLCGWCVGEEYSEYLADRISAYGHANAGGTYFVNDRIEQVLVEPSILQHSEYTPGSAACVGPTNHICDQIWAHAR